MTEHAAVGDRELYFARNSGVRAVRQLVARLVSTSDVRVDTGQADRLRRRSNGDYLATAIRHCAVDQAHHKAQRDNAQDFHRGLLSSILPAAWIERRD